MEIRSMNSTGRISAASAISEAVLSRSRRHVASQAVPKDDNSIAQTLRTRSTDAAMQYKAAPPPRLRLRRGLSPLQNYQSSAPVREAVSEKMPPSWCPDCAAL